MKHHKCFYFDCIFFSKLRSNLSAPRAGGQQTRAAAAAPERSTRPSKQVVEEEDDFGDTDVASLLD